jgi:hypothetical protein
MRMEVIGKEGKGEVIKGKIKIGQEVVIKYKGKVEKGIVVRTRGYTKTKVSYDKAGVIIKEGGGRIKGPISKGVGAEIGGVSRMQI